jgi:hypothetical protein
MENKIITKGSENSSDRCHKLCKCSKCGVVASCEPHFDFYGEAGEPLICENCLKEKLKAEGITPLNF